jgi:hypothetical protein
MPHALLFEPEARHDPGHRIALFIVRFLHLVGLLPGSRPPPAALRVSYAGEHVKVPAQRRRSCGASRSRVSAARAAAEPEILRQAPEDNAAPWRGEGWRLTGIDPEGVDLRRHGEVARIDFAAPVFSSAEARAALARLRRDAPQDRLR